MMDISENKLLIPVEPNWRPPYRLEYDGKAISLFGKDTNYIIVDYGGFGGTEYEEMVLIGCVAEVRNVYPEISSFDESVIEIELKDRYE